MATNTLATTRNLLDTAESATAESQTRFVAAERRVATARATADNKAARQQQAAGAVESAMALIATEARRGASDDPIATAETAERWVAARRVRIVEAQRRQTDAEDAFAETQRAAADLRARRGVEVDGPLAEATNDGTRLAILADIAPPTSSPGPTALAAWAATSASAARSGAADRQREAETADTEMVEARAAARAACAEAGIKPDQLERRRADLQLEVGAATEAHRHVVAVAERARALDAALAASADRSRVLGLARDLCQGRESFANHVLVARRQGLIAEAAAILTDLSSGRLTFAPDAATTFSVRDTGSEAVRDPRLLSGGEQFQASLALALGLVEIAARAGSRIECLFLDEGFAALDPASLETALDALESAARRGRRIVAVTHVDAVTARADQVLGVTGSDSGSHATWRGVESDVIS